MKKIANLHRSCSVLGLAIALLGLSSDLNAAVTVSWSGQTLKLVGDGANDTIVVSIDSGRVTYGGTGLASKSVSASSVGQIDIGGKSGNDTISVFQRETFDRAIRVFGDAGRDKITLDVTSDKIARYSVDGGADDDTLTVPNRMPTGPSGFPQSLVAYCETINLSPMAQYQKALRDYGRYYQMQSIWYGQIHDAPLRDSLAHRSADLYRLAITQFEVTHARYLPDSAGTKCNIFAGDVLRAMGTPLPTKNELPGGYGTGDITVGTPRLVSWFRNPHEGGVRGWRWIDRNNSGDLALLLNAARQGYPAIAVSPPPPGQSAGHIAVLRPDQDLTSLSASRIGDLITAQAGAKNFSRGKISDGWSSSLGRDSIQFFVNFGDVKLESWNYRGHFIRHRNSETFIDPFDDSELYDWDSSFRPVPGLADSAGVTFESVNYPGHYLRHRDYRWVLSRDDGSALFAADATFHTRAGLRNNAGVSFESCNYRGHYLRHSNSAIWLDSYEDSDLFEEDATFLPWP